MPKFAYKAKEGPSKIIDGTIDAENVDSAIQKIIQKGFSPIDVTPDLGAVPKSKKPSLASFQLIKKIRLSDVSLFTRQMSDLVEASVPLLRSMQIVLKQTQNPHFKDKVKKMHEVVEDGGSLSEALGAHPEIFSPLYINMVKAGEVGGQLEVIMSRLADHLEYEQDIRSKVRSSLAYPMLVIIVGILTMFILLTFVIPRLTVIFDDLGQDLPLPTLILTTVSSFFAQFWWLIMAILVLGGVYLRQWIAQPKGRMWLDTVKLKIPILGEFVKLVEIGRFARTLGTLMESGVVITAALNSVWATVDNVVIREEIKTISEEVSQGSSLRESLGKSRLFPEMAINMISVGEETGKLEKGLYKIADTYERQSDQTVKMLLSLLGPIVLVFIVIMVGFVVIAMLLPIFQMNLIIQ